jgi:MFS transporter, putative metabolite:H+ symporter
VPVSPEPASDRLDPYQRRLFVFLSVATFFEGYDFMALAQILPGLRSDFGLSPAQGGVLIAFINAGTVLAFFLVRLADRWGRRRVLTLTIAGYTSCSLLSGLAPDAVSFGLFQLLARIFLIGEWAVAMVYAAEEFPAARRGTVIGVIQACASLGAVTCAAVVPLLLQTPWGWRSVYFVGALPLVIIAFARRNLRETRRFAEQAGGAPEGAAPLGRILRSPYRGRMLQMALIWALTYICTHNAVVFWKEFAVAERGMSDAEVGTSLALAAIASMPLVFAVGRLLDVFGRRGGALIIFTLTAAGVYGSYTFESHLALRGALVLGIFGASAVLPVLNAYTAELFPTELRSDAFAWSNNLLGRIGYVLSPLAVGAAAAEVGWGAAISATAVFPLLALGLIWTLLPETGGRELEETSALG